MIIHAALVFEEPVSRANVVELVRTRVMTMPRFRRRLIVDGKHDPTWQPVKESPDSHVHVLHVKGHGGVTLMQAAVEALKERPLDPTLAPWDMTLVQGDDKSDCVLISRIHHAVSDGRGLVESILNCDESGHVKHGDPVAAPIKHDAHAITDGMKRIGNGLVTAAKLAVRKPDPLSSVKRKGPVQGLAVTWLPVPWQLGDVKRIGAKLGGGTVNDVVLTTIAGALRAYMQKHGDPVDKLKVRCLLPFNLAGVATKDAARAESGNLVGGGLCPLPINLDDPKARFAAVHKSMARLKHSAEPGVGAKVMTFFNNAPDWVRRPMHRFASAKATVFVSNVVGPSESMRVAGHLVRDILWFVPPLLNIGLGFPVISYQSRVCVGISADPSVVPDLDVLQQLLAEHYEKLLELS
jgi:diacylglycerol O-acyltransferase / wax synthase